MWYIYIHTNTHTHKRIQQTHRKNDETRKESFESGNADPERQTCIYLLIWILAVKSMKVKL